MGVLAIIIGLMVQAQRPTSDLPFGTYPVAVRESSCVWWPGRMHAICVASRQEVER